MDITQTASDYKEYFLKKFTSLFEELIDFFLENITDQSILDNLLKIKNLLLKLDYEKIMIKLSGNEQIRHSLFALHKNNFNDEYLNKLVKTNDKYWTIVPSLNINKIILNLTYDNQMVINDKINNLYVCACTYLKVIEQLKNKNDNENDNTFNPFESVGNIADNIDINSLFNGVEVKNISAYEMIMESIINQQMDSKMTDYMNNIKEDDVNDAANKLNDVINSDQFQGNKQTSKILADMLTNIKDEVINLKNDDNGQGSGKKNVEQLLGIAQKVAGNMMGTIKSNNINVLDLWDATSSLAKNTTNSDTLNMVDTLIRSNIEANMKRSEENIINVDNTVDIISTIDNNKISKVKKNKNKNKNKK